MGDLLPGDLKERLAQQQIVRSWLDAHQVVPQHSGDAVRPVSAAAIVKEDGAAPGLVGSVRVGWLDLVERVTPRPFRPGPRDPPPLPPLLPAPAVHAHA